MPDNVAIIPHQQPSHLSVAPEQMDLVKKTVAKGATDEELKLYLYDCARRNVHPLDRLIIFTVRTSRGERKYTPVVTVDYLRSRAADTLEYAGNDDPVYEDFPEPSKNPKSASVTVWKLVQSQRCGFTATARWSEYCPTDDKDSFMWRAKPYLMLGKCAEALALRKAFPQQLAGLYAQEEMAGESEPPPPSNKSPEAADGYISEADRRKIFQEAGKANVSHEDLKNYLLETHNINSTAKLTPEVAGDLMAFIRGVTEATVNG